MDAPACRECGVGLREGENWYDSDADQYHYICKSCRNARSAKWRQNNPAKVLLNRARRRARRKGIPFEITTRDIRIPNYCPVLGIPLEVGAESGHDSSPSLDRIDPDLGYVPGNVQVISNRANTLKSNASSEEMAAIVRHLQEIERRADDGS